MDFRKLQAFCKVYEHRSFSKAGAALFLSQPTISSHVQGLEEELGVLLFDRIGKTVVPTGAADILAAAGRDVFRRLEVARSEINEKQHRIVGEIRVGASTIPAHWVLPHLFFTFSEQFPDVTFTLRAQGTTAIIDRVASGEFDFGMVGDAAVRQSIISIPVLADEIVAVATPALIAQRELKKKSLNEWPWILRERNSGTRKVFETALERAGQRVGDASIRLESTQGVLSFAVAGVGVGVLSRLAAGPHLKSGTLEVLELNIPPIRRHLYLIHLQGRTLPAAARAFMRHVQEKLSIIL